MPPCPDLGPYSGAAAVTLQGAPFADGQNGGAHFRLWAGEGHDLTVRRVTLTRAGG